MPITLDTMRDLPWPEIDAPAIEHTLVRDLLIQDGRYSNKPLAIACAGDIVKLRATKNYGVIYHPTAGLYRY